MKASLRARSALCAMVAALLCAVLAPPVASTARVGSSLTVSPQVYVGGQRVTFTGNIGRPGVREVHLQTNPGRPGDTWGDLEGGFTARTDGDGNFRFSHPAPSMFGMSWRVVSGRLATPAWTFDARSQDLEVRVRTDFPQLDVGQALSGRPFDLVVDTTPTFPRRPDLPPPVFPGRTLTLQERVRGDRWQTLATTRTDDQGNGVFEMTVPQPGAVVYRVRQENWTSGGNQIGWFPSFPLYVEVLPGLPRTTHRTAGQSVPVRSSGPALSSGGSGAAETASRAFGWGASLWDFAWEFGESLDSRPYRGTDRRGRWVDTSDGTGRVSKHNGGLMLDSQRGYDGPGDVGTMTATLRGQPAKYGRWETRIRLKSTENDARDHRVRVELVPDRASDFHCGAQTITVAEVSPHSSGVRLGVKALKGALEWSGRRPLGSLNGDSAAFAVEVSRRHISWFVNGKVVATVSSRAAVSDVPLTLRLSLVGDGTREMNHTQAISDWQRGFSLDRGRLATGGAALGRGTHDGGC